MRRGLTDVTEDGQILVLGLKWFAVNLSAKDTAQKNSYDILCIEVVMRFRVVNMCHVINTIYTPMAVVIDNHLPRRPLILSYVPD